MMKTLWQFINRKDYSEHSDVFVDSDRTRGFTLIEMLIVIAIVGILASLVLVGLGPVQRRGRDARRTADLREVQNGLELYFNKNGEYPDDDGSWDDLEDELASADIGVRNIPSSPSGPDYFYDVNSTNNSYILGARLEDEGNPALNDDIDNADVPTGEGFTTAGSSCDDEVDGAGGWYCILF